MSVSTWRRVRGAGGREWSASGAGGVPGIRRVQGALARSPRKQGAAVVDVVTDGSCLAISYQASDSKQTSSYTRNVATMKVERLAEC